VREGEQGKGTRGRGKEGKGGDGGSRGKLEGCGIERWRRYVGALSKLHALLMTPLHTSWSA